MLIDRWNDLMKNMKFQLFVGKFQLKESFYSTSFGIE